MKKIIPLVALTGFLLTTSCGGNEFNEIPQERTFGKNKIIGEKLVEKKQLEGVVIGEFGSLETLDLTKKESSNSEGGRCNDYGIEVQVDKDTYYIQIIEGIGTPETQLIPIPILKQLIRRGSKVRFYTQYYKDDIRFEKIDSIDAYMGTIHNDRIEVLSKIFPN